MLIEESIDRSLEKMILSAEDSYLKAKTPEEKTESYRSYIELTKVYNERLKIQNDRLIAENKQSLEAEKLENDVQVERIRVEEKKKEDRIDRAERIAFKFLDSAAVGIGLGFQGSMIKHSIIETDNVSKGMTKGLMNNIGKKF